MSSGDFHRNKTACIAGHPYDDTNTNWIVNRHGRTGRVCRTCDRERMRRKREQPDFRQRETEKMRRWRAANPERNRAQGRANRLRKKEWLDAQKLQCSSCEETHIACLEFHHRDPAQKDFTLSVAVAHYSLPRIQAEAAKCDVLCSNCHRKLHWEARKVSRERTS